jgi:UDP-3-O-[3-hydroxymyristoyl] glucosamine N-acyltransferase
VPLTLAQLAELVQGTIHSLGSAETQFTGCAALVDAGPCHISFLGNERYLGQAKTTSAGVVLISPSVKDVPLGQGIGTIVVENPSAAFAEVMKHFAPAPAPFQPGIHPSAVVDPTAVVNPETVRIGPQTVIEAGVKIGDGTEIGAGVFIGEGATIGRDCRLRSRCSVMDRSILGDRVSLHAGVVIGSDGFGYEFIKGRHVKIDQIGIVQLDDDVEVGANSTIDRARFGRTWIGAGTKIDNLVQIGHNAVLGKHCIVVAQTGIAGSTRIGDFVIIAAQSGVAGHLEIGSKTVFAARSGVTKSISEPGQYMGYPATDVRSGRKQVVYLKKLPDLFDRVSELEKAMPSVENSQIPHS